ncbi:hypothetical protein CSUB01_08703 [Colletotrichum sublineola]|uniref:Uncharacterized protein n=1 Tax=Colletotrichum sublineola TaxID=1173701 RepID=A0A066X6B2_COLSU|nr:hypothetical protein CSUB01_08703 [Colletotrichum sublineola]
MGLDGSLEPGLEFRATAQGNTAALRSRTASLSTHGDHASGETCPAKWLGFTQKVKNYTTLRGATYFGPHLFSGDARLLLVPTLTAIMIQVEILPFNRLWRWYLQGARRLELDSGLPADGEQQRFRRSKQRGTNASSHARGYEGAAQARMSMLVRIFSLNKMPRNNNVANSLLGHFFGGRGGWGGGRNNNVNKMPSQAQQNFVNTMFGGRGGPGGGRGGRNNRNRKADTEAETDETRAKRIREEIEAGGPGGSPALRRRRGHRGHRQSV